MTTFAETAPPLRRLFSRLDYAPDPHADDLKRLLHVWKHAREGRAMPCFTEDIAEAMGRAAFVFRQDRDTDEHVLLAGAAGAGALLGSCPIGHTLSAAADHRVAARLRRLFDSVLQSGEPLLAEFARKEHGKRAAVIEILAAPLSSGGDRADMVLAGAAWTPVAVGAMERPVLGADSTADDLPLVFALDGGAGLGARIAASLGVQPAPHEEREFEDGEHKARPLCDVTERDVYVVDSLVADAEHSPNDRLCRFLFFVGALKDAGAARVTAVVPYLCYARKDRETKSRDPITSRYVAQLFEAMGTHRVIGMDLHNLAAFQNAFRCDTEHLSARDLFVRHFAEKAADLTVTVVSPDLGGGKRADLFREALEGALGRPVGKAFMEKGRSMGRVTGDLFAGDVAGHHAIIIDDLISTGTTMARVAAACRSRGAVRVSVAATHAVFTAGAEALWREASIDEVVATDTVPAAGLDDVAVRGRLVILPVAKDFAEAIRRSSFRGAHRAPIAAFNGSG